jgi:5-formyltetrahydrofolate cyclo-ligase
VSNVTDPAEIKAALRRRLLAARRAVPAERATRAAAAARDHLLSALAPPPGAVVGGYWPIRGELDPRPLLAALAARGHAVALPVTPPPQAAPKLSFRLWDGAADSLVTGPFNTRQPPESAPEAAPTWLLVPLAGFDRRGVRLGYGGGYYDRFMAEWTGGAAVGYGYACQEVPLNGDAAGLPAEAHDVPLAAIVTEAGVIHPDGAESP